MKPSTRLFLSVVFYHVVAACPPPRIQVPHDSNRSHKVDGTLKRIVTAVQRLQARFDAGLDKRRVDRKAFKNACKRCRNYAQDCLKYHEFDKAAVLNVMISQLWAIAHSHQHQLGQYYEGFIPFGIVQSNNPTPAVTPKHSAGSGSKKGPLCPVLPNAPVVRSPRNTN